MDLDINPGIGLGCFRLGAYLYDILNYLRLKEISIYSPKINIIFSSDEPIFNPIILHVVHSGLRLLFDGATQRLREVEVLDISKSRLHYKGNEIAKAGSLNFRNIYGKLFGPTYPGQFEDNTYVLSYPGIAFTFLNIPDEIKKVGDDGDKDAVLRYLQSPQAPNCAHIGLFTGTSWHQARKTIFASDELPDPPKEENLVLSLKVVERPAQNFAGRVNGSKAENVILLKLTRSEYILRLGSTSMSEIIMALGPPDERYVKEESRLSIHSSKSHSDSSAGIIFNYYRHGLDICFAPNKTCSAVNKVIVHGNVPGSLSFGKYRRCPWVLKGNDAPYSEQKFQDYAENFVQPGDPMPLNKHIDSPSSSVELVGEVDRVDFWGLSDLYGMKGALFEVLKNGCVDSLTLY